MLHAKIINIKEKKISLSEAEKIISSSEFGASIYFDKIFAVPQLTLRALLTGKSAV